MPKKEDNKVSEGWKIAAIILGITTFLLIALLVYGARIAEAENTCNKYCYENGFESYHYYISEDMCDCYVNEEVVRSISIIGKDNGD